MAIATTHDINEIKRRMQGASLVLKTELSGLRTDQVSGNYLGFARAVYYHQIGNMPLLGRGIYLGGSLEAGNVWAERGDISATGLYTAGSVFVAADTWLGPFYFAYGRASGGHSSFYIFLGRL